jgi:hypothetical protein
VPWYDDPALYYGPPGDVLAQGDIVVATTGVSRVTVATYPRLHRYTLVKIGLCRCGLARLAPCPKHPALGYGRAGDRRWFFRTRVHWKRNSTSALRP